MRKLRAAKITGFKLVTDLHITDYDIFNNYDLWIITLTDSQIIWLQELKIKDGYKTNAKQ